MIAFMGGAVLPEERLDVGRLTEDEASKDPRIERARGRREMFISLVTSKV
jgi:hypothetical protein